MLSDRAVGRPRYPRPRHQISDKLFLPGLLLTYHGGSGNGGMRSETLLDLAKLDSDPVDLYLVIYAAAKVELAVGKPADQIACSVQTVTAERVRDETLGS